MNQRFKINEQDIEYPETFFPIVEIPLYEHTSSLHKMKFFDVFFKQ